jgi:hypothetical protein
MVQAKGEDGESDGPSKAGPIGVRVAGEDLQTGLVRVLLPLIPDVFGASPLCRTARGAGPDLITDPQNVSPHLLDDLRFGSHRKNPGLD